MSTRSLAPRRRTSPLRPVAPPIAIADRSSLRRAALHLAAVVVLLAAVAGGWLAGGSLRHARATDSPPPHAISAGPLQVTVSGQWSASAPARGLAGDGLRDLRVFAVTAGMSARAWIARAGADDPSLLPARLRARFAGRVPEPRRTTLAGARAWTYRAIPVKGGDLVELTVVPTTAGVLLVGCEATVSWWSAVAGCADGVLGVSGARRVPPATDIAYRQHAPHVLTRLNRRRAHLAHGLAHARRARRQAHFARQLAAEHRTAARRLSPLAPESGPARRVVRSLRRSGTAYAALAHAAHRQAPRPYKRARHDVARADHALARALRRAA